MSPRKGHDHRPPLLWRAPLSRLWLRPWYDRLATWSVARLQLPLSRAWATEDEAGPAVERLAAAEAAWAAGLFGAAAPANGDLVALERWRRRAAVAWMLRRLRHPLAPLRVPPAAYALDGPAAVAARHGDRLADPTAAYPARAATIEVSHALQHEGRATRWLRFAAADGGTAWARLDSPPGPVRGTLVALHGVCIEEAFWPPAPDYTDRALAAGWQVLRPEAPGHGRRRRPGTYGGEPLIAGGPGAFLDHFALAIPELAVWTAWARQQGQGPVAWAGVSLGALTAQKAAEAALGWPVASRPDGLLLIATAGQLAQATLDGSLGRLLRLRPRLRAAGWTEQALARWGPLLDPLGPVPMPAGRVRLLLGSADTLLPFAQGAALVHRWRLPSERVTVRRQGHFSISLGLLAQPEPLLDWLEALA